MISVNPLEFRGNYSATSNHIKFVHWPLMGGLLHLVQRGGDWVARPLPSPLYQMSVQTDSSLSVRETKLFCSCPSGDLNM